MKFIAVAALFVSCTQLFAQPTPPSSVTVRLGEDPTEGCFTETDCASGVLCWDVYFEIDEDGWDLQSYNIWIDYGPDSTVLSYASDSSCNHEDGGDVNVNSLGKYRFLAANFALPLNAGEEQVIHNFCIEILDLGGIENISASAGGDFFGLVSSVNLVDRMNAQNAINPVIPNTPLTLDATTVSCLAVDPMADFDCDANSIMLMADGEDATGPGIVDCETFTYAWSGPSGYTSQMQNPIILVLDPALQSGDYTVTVTGQNGCEGIQTITIDENNCAALPVEFLSFNARKSGEEVELKWATSSEINNDFFDVQRSYDGREFRSIGEVKGNGTVFSTSEYKFMDKAPQEANYYRLMQVDMDGTESFSDIRFIAFGSDADAKERSVFPNPFTSELTLELGQPGLYHVEMYKSTGEVVKRINIVNGQSLTLNDLSSGSYIIKAFDAAGNEIFVETVVKINRS